MCICTPQFFNVVNVPFSGSSYIAEPCRAAECLVPPMRPKHTVLGTRFCGCNLLVEGLWLQIVLLCLFLVESPLLGARLAWAEPKHLPFGNGRRMESMSSACPLCVFLSLRRGLFIDCLKPLISKETQATVESPMWSSMLQHRKLLFFDLHFSQAQVRLPRFQRDKVQWESIYLSAIWSFSTKKLRCCHPQKRCGTNEGWCFAYTWNSPYMALNFPEFRFVKYWFIYPDNLPRLWK